LGARARPGKGSAGLVGDACGVLAWPLPEPCRVMEAEMRGAEAANRAGGGVVRVKGKGEQGSG